MAMAWRDQFLEDVRHGISPDTRAAYKKSVRTFEDWLESRGLNVQSAPASALQDFVDHMQEHDAAPSTIQWRVSAARQYVQWCYARSIRTADMRNPKMPPRSPTTAPLTGLQLKAFLDTCMEMVEPYRTALMLIPLAGMRPDEVAYVRVRDITLSPAVTLRICTHRGERIAVPLRPAWPVLAHYIAKVRPQLGDTEWLFPMGKNQRSITKRSVKRRVTAARLYCRHPAITVEALRATFIDLLQQSSVPEVHIRKLVGNRRYFLGRKHTKSQMAIDPSPDELVEKVRHVLVPWTPPKRNPTARIAHP